MSRLRTVLVDDVREMRHVVRTLLRHDGRFDVVGEASNGSDAIGVVAEARPDLVVLDIGMPVLDGIAALPRLREVSPETRIVMLSGFPAEHMEQAAIEGGAVGYLEKAADIAELPDQLHALAAVLDTVQHVLDRSYDADTSSPRKARADLRSALAAQVEQDALSVIELLTTELVTNAVVHAGSTARVAAALAAGRIRVTVTNDGEVRPVRPADPGLEAESGRGLALVEALSSDWGVEPFEGGMTVWFETAV